MSGLSLPISGSADKPRSRSWVIGLVAALVIAAVVVIVMAIPRGSATERAEEVARIQNEIAGAFASAGVAPEDLELNTGDEACRSFLPSPWKGIHTYLRLTTEAAVEPTDVIAALGVETGRGVNWVEVQGATAEHTIAFKFGANGHVTVSSQTGCYAE